MPRLFVALLPPPEARATMAAMCRGLEGARWVSPEQVHITLRFLGEVGESAATDLAARLASVRCAAPCVRLAGVGTFPAVRGSHVSRVTVLWAGVEPAAPLNACKAAVDAALGADSESRPYHPHFTLARFKSPPRADLLTYLRIHQELRSPPFLFDTVHLMESRLSPRGATHTVRAAVHLAPSL